MAINLKLKDSAKGTVAVNTMLGGGIQWAGGWHIGSRPLDDGQTVIGQNPLWTAEVVGMYFAKRRQNMTLYKGNNTGDDVWAPSCPAALACRRSAPSTTTATS